MKPDDFWYHFWGAIFVALPFVVVVALVLGLARAVLK